MDSAATHSHELVEFDRGGAVDKTDGPGLALGCETSGGARTEIDQIHAGVGASVGYRNGLSAHPMGSWIDG
jgi:hypothetical protein